MKTAQPAVLVRAISKFSLDGRGQVRFGLSSGQKFQQIVASRFGKKYISLCPLCLCGEIIFVHHPLRSRHGEHGDD